jgi:hypothetical protein
VNLEKHSNCAKPKKHDRKRDFIFHGFNVGEEPEKGKILFELK